MYIWKNIQNVSQESDGIQNSFLIDLGKRCFAICIIIHISVGFIFHIIFMLETKYKTKSKQVMPLVMAMSKESFAKANKLDASALYKSKNVWTLSIV